MYNLFKYLHSNNGDNMNISSLMSSNIISCDFNTSVLEVSKLMIKNNVVLVIVGDRVITDRDLLKILINGNDIVLYHYCVEFISIDINSSILLCFDLMSYYKIKRLIVINKKEIVGVISLSDLIGINDEMFLNTFNCIYENMVDIRQYDSNIDDFLL